MTEHRVEYWDGFGNFGVASVIATFAEPKSGKIWVSIWEPIRAEPIWINPENVERTFFED